MKGDLKKHEKRSLKEIGISFLYYTCFAFNLYNLFFNTANEPIKN